MGKLVRDRIPEIILLAGGSPTTRRLDPDEYRSALHAKLREEGTELVEASSAGCRLEEAADILEVVAALVRIDGHTIDDVIEVATAKRQERGGFDERTWLE